MPAVAAAAVAAAKPVPKYEETGADDPIKEADLFLNFGRDAQAEEILKDALKTKPSNIPVQLKLLSIYANRKDANSFSRIARQIQDSGDEAAWQQAAALGRGIDPGNPMYGEGEAAPLESAAEAAKPAAPPPLDMDIGFNVPMDLDVTASMPAEQAPPAPAMDFDVSGFAAAPMDFDVSSSQANPAGQADVVEMGFDLSGSQPNLAMSPQMDFDVTGTQPKAIESQHMDFDVTGSQPKAAEVQPMDFDITGSQPNVAAVQPMDFDITGSQPNVAESQRLDFDVTSSHPNLAETQVMSFDITGGQSKVSGIELMDFGSAPGQPDLAETQVLDFNMDQTMPNVASAPEAGGSAPAFAPMDFDISAPSSDKSKAAEPAFALDTGGLTFDVTSPPSAKSAANVDFPLGDLSLDLAEGEPQASAAADGEKSEQWQEVSTKLDLARAYHEMGDTDGAREILGEVLRDGDEQQREAAQALMQQF